MDIKEARERRHLVNDLMNALEELDDDTLIDLYWNDQENHLYRDEIIRRFMAERGK